MAAQLPQNNKFFQLSQDQFYKAARKALIWKVCRVTGGDRAENKRKKKYK